jgi:lactate dehydrogenase-like 2-hydroxyacid dehydrogenase
MTQLRVLVTRRWPGEVERALRERYEVVLNEGDRPLGSDELAQAMGDFDVLCPTVSDKIDDEVIGGGDRVKLIANYGVGFDHIDIAAAKAKGIAVTNTPGVLTDATADIAMLLILGAARGASWGERMIREGRWTSWSPTAPLGLDVSGKTLGIIGMGRIGQALARRARGFDMPVHYFNRRRLPPEHEFGARYHSELAGMLPLCDFLSINCASTPETRGMVDKGVIRLLPDGAIIVNSARGDIVNDDDLIDALTSGKLAAAGLDVFRNEPNIDARFLELDNVFLLPHLGSATPNTRTAMGMRAVDNLEAFFQTGQPRDRLV